MRIPKYLQWALSFAMIAICALSFTESHAITHLGLFDSFAVATGGTMIGGCISIASISEECGSNPGGLNELFLVRKEDVKTFPDTTEEDGVVLEGDIVLKDGKFWAKWDFGQDTGEITVKGAGEDGSQAFEQSVGVFIPRMTPEISKIINNALNQKYIVAVRDGKGQVQVMGDQYRPCTFEFDYKSGKKFNDKNGGDYTFKCGTSHMPYYYEGKLLTQAAPVVVAPGA